MAKSNAPAPAAQADTQPAQPQVKKAAPAPAAQEVPAGFMAVEYIGRREPHTDGLYGTRIEWDAVGSVRLVPEDVARKMVATNKDVYREGEYGGESKPPAQAEAPVQDWNRQELDIVIQTMDKDALEAYAKTHYRQNLDKRRAVETLRQEVARMVDQFGAP